MGLGEITKSILIRWTIVALEDGRLLEKMPRVSSEEKTSAITDIEQIPTRR